jgi:hypothetical protein
VELDEKLCVAWSRIQRDRSTDFLIGDFEYVVFGAHSSTMLGLLQEDIESGADFGTVPVRTIRVPKDTSSHTTRPGAVPEIADRLVYQYLVDDIADAVESSLVAVEEGIVHSYRYSGDRESAEMFAGFDVASYKTFQERVAAISAGNAFLVVADVADFYERLYHHVLESLLRGLGAPTEASEQAYGVASSLASWKVLRGSRRGRDSLPGEGRQGLGEADALRAARNSPRC